MKSTEGRKAMEKDGAKDILLAIARYTRLSNSTSVEVFIIQLVGVIGRHDHQTPRRRHFIMCRRAARTTVPRIATEDFISPSSLRAWAVADIAAPATRW